MNTALRTTCGYTIALALAALLLWSGVVRAQVLVIDRVTVDVKQENNQATATISWFTNQTADGRVDYGTTTSYGTYVASSIMTTFHEIILTGLRSDTTYHFKLTSVTSSGGRLESFDQTFKTPKFKETVAPAVTDVRVAAVSATYFVVWWRTDEPSDSRVEFSTDAALKRPGFASGTAKATEHEVIVGRLKPGLTYYWRVRSRDKDKNEGFGPIQQVTLVTADRSNEKDPLTIRLVSPVSSPDPAITDTTVTFTWQTPRLAKGHVELRGIKAPGKRVTETGFNTSDHRLVVTGLKPATRYLVKIYARDVLGKTLTSGEIDLTTAPPPPHAPRPPGAVGGVSCRGPYAYGSLCRDLAAERALAVELRNYLTNIFRGRVPAAARQNWFTLVNAYTYGGYPAEALVAAVRHGGKTVHPTIPWVAWKDSRDYRSYINKK